MKSYLDFVKAGIFGLAVGDALGLPVEFKSREALISDPVTGMRGYGTYNQPPGTWSDDTSMTICLLDSLSGGLNYEDVMNNFLEWYREGAYTPHGEAFDIGKTTSSAIGRFADGTEPLKCGGVSELDNGNGSLMRILPLLFYLYSVYGEEFYHSKEAFGVIHNVSSLTHAHKRSQIACGIYLTVAAELIKSSLRSQVSSAVSIGINNALEYYRSQNEFATELQYYMRLSEDNFGSLPVSSIRSSGYVVDTLEAALWCILNTDNYKDCVLKAVNLGEDTDTVAAVAGGLAGLFYGYESIPQEWLDLLYRRNYIEDLCNKFKGGL